MSVITITKENFDQQVLQNSKPVLLDFWASWCGPCRMLSPVVDEIAQGFTRTGMMTVLIGIRKPAQCRSWRRR